MSKTTLKKIILWKYFYTKNNIKFIDINTMLYELNKKNSCNTFIYYMKYTYFAFNLVSKLLI